MRVQWDGTRAATAAVADALKAQGFPFIMTEFSERWGNLRVHSLARHLELGRGGVVVSDPELYADQPTDWAFT